MMIMAAAIRNLLVASFVCGTLPAVTRAQPPSLVPLGEAPSTALPDTVFRAVGDRPVALLLTDRTAVRVRILTIEPERLIISFLDGGQVMTLPRASVTAVRLLETVTPVDPALDPEAPAGPARPRPRYVGASVSFLPGFTLDLDLRRFRAFANVGILLAGATQGGFIPISIGLGAGLPLWRGVPGLKLELFAHLNFVGDVHGDSDFGFHGGNWLAFGVGLGMHRTWDNGLTLGFTLPVLGYARVVGAAPFSNDTDLATKFGYYYATSAEALPNFYIGYRK